MANIENYQDIIDRAAITAAISAAPGAFIPWLDTKALSACWIQMILDMAQQSGCEIDEKVIEKFVNTILDGAPAYFVSNKALIPLLNFIPIAGTVPGMGLTAVLHCFFTLRLGEAIAERFEQPDFNIEYWFGLAPIFTAMVFALPSLPELQEMLKILTSSAHSPKKECSLSLYAEV